MSFTGAGPLIKIPFGHNCANERGCSVTSTVTRESGIYLLPYFLARRGQIYVKPLRADESLIVMLEVKNGLDISRLKVQVYALTDLGDSLEKSLFSQLGRAVQWLPIVLWAPAGTINVDVLRVEAERVGLHHVCHLPIQHTNSCEKKITHKVRRLGYQTYLVTYQTRLPKVNVLEKVWQSDRWRRDSERMISGFRRWRGDKTWGYKKKKTQHEATRGEKRSHSKTKGNWSDCEFPFSPATIQPATNTNRKNSGNKRLHREIQRLQSSSFNEQAYKASPADAAPTDTTPFCCRVNINQAGY